MAAFTTSKPEVIVTAPPKEKGETVEENTKKQGEASEKTETSLHPPFIDKRECYPKHKKRK